MENKELERITGELIELGIEELESRQEMALLAGVDEVDGNSKCTKNDACNTVSGCGGTTSEK